MITATVINIFWTIAKVFIGAVLGLGNAVFSFLDLITMGKFNAVVPMLDSFVDVNLLRTYIGVILSIYLALWSAFLVNWVIKRIRGG